MRRQLLLLALAFLWSASAQAMQAPLPIPQPVESPEPFDDTLTVVPLKDPEPFPEASPPPVSQEEKNTRPEGVQVTIVAGGTVLVSSETEASVNPFARVGVALPLSTWDMTPTLYLRLDLNALPEESISFENPSSFRSGELYLSPCQPIHPTVFFDACLGGGVASRLPGELRSSDRAVYYADFHLRYSRTGRGWLEVGLGRSQLFDGLWKWALTASGTVKLYTVEAIKGSLQLVGDVSAGLEASRPNGPRTLIMRVGIVVGR